MTTTRQSDIERRTRRYWYEDGLAEISVGLLFGAVSLLLVVEAVSPAGTLPPLVAVLGLPLLALIGMVAVRFGVRVAKDHLTYPRTGFLVYRRRTPGRRALGWTTAAVLGVVFAVALSAWSGLSAWLAVLEGLVLAIGLLALASVMGLGRFYVVAGVALAAGCSAALLGLTDNAGSALVYGAFGTALVVSGGLTLRSYLRRAGAADPVDR